MSEPLHAWQGENDEPRPDPIWDMQPAGDAGHDARTNGWFHRTPSRPDPMSEETWLSLQAGTHPLSLAQEQIDYLVARESLVDAVTDEQYWHDTVLFDRAIDDDRYWRNGRLCAEPEIDDREIE